MLRRLVKTGLAAACHWTGADLFLARAAGVDREPLVLAYHRVVDDLAGHPASIPAMLTQTRTLERQLDWLGRHYRIVSLDELGRLLESGACTDAVAAITFDDGYQDVYQNAYPLLRRKGMPGAVFVVTDLIGTARLHLHDRLFLLLRRAFVRWTAPEAELAALLRRLELRPCRPPAAGRRLTPLSALRRLLGGLSQAEAERVRSALEQAVGLGDHDAEAFRPLSWEMLETMVRGGITIGSHTRSHAVLTNESRRRQLDEAAGSRSVLERCLGVPVRHFAYPSGCFDDGVVDVVRASSYRFAYTTCRCRDLQDPLLTIPRRGFWEGSCLDTRGRFSPAIMSCYTHGVFALQSRCREDHGPRAPRRPALPRGPGAS